MILRYGSMKFIHYLGVAIITVLVLGTSVERVEALVIHPSSSKPPVVIGNREWRQLYLGSGISYNQMAEYYDTSTGRLKDPSINTISGRASFEDYIWASMQDFVYLLHTYGRSLENLRLCGGCSDEALNTPSGDLYILLDDFRFTKRTYVSGCPGIHCKIIYELNGSTRDVEFVTSIFGDTKRVSRTVFITDDRTINSATGRVTLYSGLNLNQANSSVGKWMYRNINTVPEPASLALLGLGLVGFGIMRKRRR